MSRPRSHLLIDERLVLGMIALNTLVVFLRAFPQLAHWDNLLLWVDVGCTLYFVVEVSLKLHLLRWGGFWSVAMNRFDLAVVALSLPTLLSLFWETEHLGLILVLRAARLVRVLRVFRFIPRAEQLWSGIRRALRASVGLIFGLALYDMVIGLVACHFFHDVAPEHFSDPIASMYTIFKVFTVEGWYEIPDAIAAGAVGWTGTLARGFFVFVVLTGGVLGLGIANAALVDEMVVDNTYAVEAEVAALRVELMTLRDEHGRLLADIHRHLTRGDPPAPVEPESPADG